MKYNVQSDKVFNRYLNSVEDFSSKYKALRQIKKLQKAKYNKVRNSLTLLLYLKEQWKDNSSQMQQV